MHAQLSWREGCRKCHASVRSGRRVGWISWYTRGRYPHRSAPHRGALSPKQPHVLNPNTCALKRGAAHRQERHVASRYRHGQVRGRALAGSSPTHTQRRYSLRGLRAKFKGMSTSYSYASAVSPRRYVHPHRPPPNACPNCGAPSTRPSPTCDLPCCRMRRIAPRSTLGWRYLPGREMW